MDESLLVAWFMIDEPRCYPVLLAVGRRRDGERGLDIPSRVYKEGARIAGLCRISRPVHVGTFSAYLGLLNECNR